MKEWIYIWIDERMNRIIGEWKYERMKRRINERMNTYMNRWKNE